MGQFGVGQAVTRLEDQRLLTGGGRYTDDIDLPGQAYLVLLRSPVAHAELGAIDGAAAAAAPGVLAVYTAADLAAEGIGDIPCLAPVEGRAGSAMSAPPFPVLARERVRYVGDAVAAVIAETRAEARNAAELIRVDYRALPPVVEARAALEAGSPQLHEAAPGNLCVDWELGDQAATEAAFAEAARQVSVELVNNRVVVNPIEPRVCLGDYDAASGRFTLHTGSQGSHRLRNQIAEHIFEVTPEQVRVLTPDVGGGFGMKIFLYADQVMALFAARRLGRPVKWTGERGEDFLSDSHGRDQWTRAALALDAEARILAIRVDTIANLGAYCSNFGPMIPTLASGRMFGGLYRMKAAYCNVRCAFTNTVPVDAYRGAGRPEAAYIVERLVDQAARETGLGRDEIRRRNLIRPEDLPYTTAMGITYDSGDFARVMAAAQARAGWESAEARKAEARGRGRLRGIGLACYVEACGGVGEEEARVRLDDDGGITLIIGTQTNGQGHATAYTQLLCERLGLEPERVRVRQGDSDDLGHGGGTGGSRSLMMGGLALAGATDKLVERLRGIAGQLLEAAEADLELAEAAFAVVGTDRRVGFAEIAAAAPAGQTLEGFHHTPMQTMTFPNGCHVCELEVDPETGEIEIARYVVVDDFGTVINPELVRGQVYGGLVQGLGQALLEQTVFDPESGQLLTGSFMDYRMPRADDMPAFEVLLDQAMPCTTNPMGVKGAGEAGAIGAPPAAISALIDALAPLGADSIDMPATPERVWRAIQAARGAGTGAAA